MEFKYLIVEKKDDGVAWIKLNRPSVLNALNRGMVSELLAALDEIERDPTVRVVVIKGNGRAFCAGADLEEYPLGGGVGEDLGFCGLWEKIEYLEKPVIAAVHGYAITGGFLLSYCCDLVVAAENAKFGDTHARLGLVPTGGETQRLPRRIGLIRAKELMFTSEMIDARQAEQIGLVNKVVPEDKLDDAVAELARKIASNSAKSLRIIKSLINRGMEVDFATGLRLEAVANKWGKINAEPDEDRDRRLARFRKAKS
jgi:enoyl-CoA hydratase/carnithine racemase